MRFLFCFVGGQGHFEPMAPVARAAQAAGHTVAVACGSSQVPAVEAAGFPAFPIGPPPPPSPTRLPLLEVNAAREEQTLRERFAKQAARLRARGVLALAADWRPDAIVADEADFGSLIAAEVLDVPYGEVLVLAAGSLIRAEVVAATVDQVRGEYGLPPDPDLAAPSRYLVLTPFPPSLRDPNLALPATAKSFRAVDVGTSEGPSPPWAGQPGEDPLVYFTLGTEFNVESGDLFARVLAGLGDLPARVLVTVGHQIDPAELGRQPAQVCVERYLPQAHVLPYCEAVVFHGGSGTLTGVAAYGLPMVLLAMGADQPANAQRCQALGVAVNLDPVQVTPQEIRDSVLTVLTDPDYRRAARRLQAEMAAQPDVATTVGLLERLATEQRPIE